MKTATINGKAAKTAKTATQNACKLCNPLGACLAFRGIEKCVPFLHGSQGCATYIRRYLISHYKEPIDIASSNFNEETAVFGGSHNLQLGLKNVTQQYKPEVIGIATTCLSETIGDDVPMILKEYKAVMGNDEPLPVMIFASTPSYSGTHIDGFHAAVRSAVTTLAEGTPKKNLVNIFPGMISPADIRYLKEILNAFGIPLVDAYADGHKYVFGKRAILYGEEDLVISMAAFLHEIGVLPVLCASGGKSGLMKKRLLELVPDLEESGIKVRENVDFVDIEHEADELRPDLLIGNSKGFTMSKKHDLPLIRIGFPIHDRFGGQRLHHLGYRGTQELFDRIVNTVIEGRQKSSSIGYTYM